MSDSARLSASRQPLHAHVWEREEQDLYVEEPWVSRRLFEDWKFEGEVYDPACGFGHIVRSAQDAGLKAWGSDIIQRIPTAYTFDFFDCLVHADNIVCNPPFGIIEEFTKHACRIADGEVAMIFPMRRLNAAGAWLKTLPLRHVYYLTPRPSMTPGHVYKALQAKGKRPSGGTQDFCWLIFSRDWRGAPTVGWLHRDA